MAGMSEHPPGQSWPAYPPPTSPRSPWAPPVVGAPMPGAVLAALIVTYVWAAVTAGLALLFGLLAVVIGQAIVSTFAPHARAELAGIVLARLGVALAFAIVLGVLGWHTAKRRSWARWGLVACGVLGMAQAVLLRTPWSLFEIPFGATVMVLLCLPATTAWFRRTPVAPPD